MKRIFGLISFLFTAPVLFSQIDSNSIYSRKIDAYYTGDSILSYLDTNLFGLHLPNRISFLGNIGLPEMPLLFQFQMQNLSNQAFDSHLNVPTFKLKDVNFSHSSRPLFSVYAFSGRGKEQLLDVFHTQTLRKQFSYTFRFYRGNSQGFVNRQRSNFSQFYLALSIPLFNNKKGIPRLQLLPYVINNLNNFNENGAVVNRLTLDSLADRVNFFDNSDISFLKVRLLSANRKIGNTAFGSEQNILIKYDTLNKIRSSLVHTIGVDRQKNNYEDLSPIKDTSIYPAFFDTTAFVKDSMRLSILSNAIAYRIERHKHFSYTAGARYEHSRYTNHSNKNFYDNYELFLQASQHINFKQNIIQVTGHGAYNFKGNLRQGFLINANADWVHSDSIKKLWHVQAQFDLSNRKPLLYFQQYKANSFIWNNAFKSIFNQQVHIVADYLPLRIRAGIYTQLLNNAIFNNIAQQPEQSPKAISNTRVYAAHQLSWKRLRLNNTLHYQVTTAPDLMRMPNLYTNHALYFETKKIKNNFIVQAGVDVQLIPKFKSYAYSPALNQFYLQENFESANQLYADVFLNIYIRPAYIFIKMEHANQFYYPQQSEVVAGYLMKPRALRFGLRWNFLD